jgi:hypothetical protein
MKTAIIIDCSAIFYQVINRVCGYNGKNIQNVVNSGRKYLTKEDEQLSFLQDIHDEFNGLNNYTTILGTDGIYFAFDSIARPSFRFDMYPEYKKSKSRLKEQVYDRDIFKSMMKTYHDKLVENNFKVIEHSGIEADDIFYEFKKVIPEYMNIGIITPDSDIEQLLDERTFIYNSILQDTKVSPNFRYGGEAKETDNVIDFFFASVEDAKSQQGYERFFSNKIVVDPNVSLFKKIIIGDDMDNIPAFFRYKTKNGNSEFGFTKDRYKQFEEKNKDCISLEYLTNDTLFKELLNRFSETVGRELDVERLDEYRRKKDFNTAMINLSESNKYHKQSPELYGTIMDQYKKHEVDFGVISFYEKDIERY